jgi:hypothetical protein
MNSKIKYRVIEVSHFSDYGVSLFRLQVKLTFLWWTRWSSMTYYDDRFVEFCSRADAEMTCQDFQVSYRKSRDQAVVVFYPNEF